MKLFKYFYLSALLPFFLVGCSSEHENTSETDVVAGDASTVVFSLEGDAPEDDLRALDITLTDKGASADYRKAQTFSSVCVLVNKARTKAYYFNVTWTRKAGSSALTTTTTPTTTLDGTPITLSTREEWYLTGYLGGTYTHANKRVSYKPNPNVLTGLQKGGTQNRDIPVFFPWVKLKLTNGQSGSFVLSKFVDPANSSDTKIKFQILGTILRVNLKNNNVKRLANTSYGIVVKDMVFESNVMTTSDGYYNLALAGLPAVTSTNASTYVPTSTTERRYTFADANTTHKGIVLASGATHTRSYLVWATPTNTSEAKPVTHLMASVKRLNSSGAQMALPVMNNLFIWGSRGKPQHGTKVAVNTNIVRAKTAWEYLRDGYYQNGVVFEHKQEESTLAVPAGTGIPTYNQLAVFTDHNEVGANRPPSSIVFSSSKTFTNGTYISNDWFVRTIGMIGRTTVPGLNLTVKAPTPTTRGIFYILSGYRNMQGNGEVALTNSKSFQGLTQGSKDFYCATRITSSTSTANIKQVYLGPNYVGPEHAPFEDSFYTKYASDVVTRTYPPVIGSFYGLNNASGTITGPVTWTVREENILGLFSISSMVDITSDIGDFYYEDAFRNRIYYDTRYAPAPYAYGFRLPIILYEHYDSWEQ